MESCLVSPPNGILFLLDPETGVIPEFWDIDSILAAETCLALETLAEMDGETRVTLGDLQELTIPAHLELRWTGVVPTTSGVIAVTTSHNEVLVSVPVDSPVIQVWTNAIPEPDEILIAIVGGE